MALSFKTIMLRRTIKLSVNMVNIMQNSITKVSDITIPLDNSFVNNILSI